MIATLQAVAAIVESAQSIDGFLASNLIGSEVFFLNVLSVDEWISWGNNGDLSGRTYGLQLYPEVMMVTWSPEFCRLELDGEEESALEDCTPFHNCGPVILTAGLYPQRVISKL